MVSPSQRVGICRISLVAVLGLLATVLALALAVAACGDEGDGGGSNGDEPASIIGVWEDPNTGETAEFTADGRFVSEETEGLNMTYVVLGNELTFESDFGSGTTVEFVLEGDTLKIEDYETGEFETMQRVD